MLKSFNRFALVAALLMAVTSAAHLLGGEFDVHRPLLATAKTTEDALYVSVLWHGVSAMLVLNTLAACYGARWHAPAVLWLAGAQTVALGLVFMAYGLLRTGSLFIAPQWTILLLAGAFAFLAAREWRSRRARSIVAPSHA